MSELAGVAITTVLLLLVIVDIVGNSVVCAIIKRNREMRIPINYLLFNLAIADILYAMCIVPKVLFKLAFTHHPGGITGTLLCKLLTHGNIAWIGGASSVVTLVAIAIERYYAVVYPFGNKWKLTKHKLKVIIPGIWVFALILNIPEFSVTEIEETEIGNFCVYTWPKELMSKTNSLTGLVVVFFSLLLMVVLYSRVVCTLWFKQNDDSHLTHQQKGVARVRKRVTLMVVTITAIFGICWGTDSVVYVLNYAKSFNIGPVTSAITYTMVLFNSAVNPFVYALFNKQFREKMKGMLCCTGSSAPRFIRRQNHRTWSLPTTPPTRPTQQHHANQSNVSLRFMSTSTF
ncbi:hypothetical protein ACROYT_G038808 [Oculina patagonica]